MAWKRRLQRSAAHAPDLQTPAAAMRKDGMFNKSIRGRKGKKNKRSNPRSAIQRKIKITQPLHARTLTVHVLPPIRFPRCTFARARTNGKSRVRRAYTYESARGSDMSARAETDSRLGRARQSGRAGFGKPTHIRPATGVVASVAEETRNNKRQK